jgi:hypothetical protein
VTIAVIDKIHSKMRSCPSSISNRRYRCAFAFVYRSKACSSQARPVSFLDQPVEDELISTEWFAALIESTQADWIALLAASKMKFGGNTDSYAHT